jgi:hypothetical protein
LFWLYCPYQLKRWENDRYRLSIFTDLLCGNDFCCYDRDHLRRVLTLFRRIHEAALLFIGMVWLLLLLSCPHLLAQSKNTQKDSTKSQATFKVPVNVIVVNVTVTDKRGNPVNDLTSSDFKLSDEGKPQAIQTFALESYGPVQAEGEKTPETSPQRAAATPEPGRAEATSKPDRPRMISS